jgi:outer membrane protein TolC
MPFKVNVVMCAALCLTLLPLYAQAPLTLEEALHLAKQNNLGLQKQSESQRIARLEEWVQKANRLPALEASFSASYLSETNKIDLSRLSQQFGAPAVTVELGGHDRYEMQLGIRQPIFTGFRLKSQVELAKNASLSEAAKFDILSNEIYHRVHLLFYQVQSLYTQRKILDASLRRLQIQLENVRNLYEAAQAMAFDTLQVYNGALAIKIEIENNQLKLNLAQLQMARLLDLSPPRPIAEVDILPPTGEGSDLDQLREEAVRKRAELETVRLAQNSALLQQKLARSTFFPTIFGQANYHYSKPGLNPVLNQWMDYFSVGATLQWNLWRWGGDRNKVEEAEVQHNRLQLEERELLRTISYEVEEAFENLRFSLEEWRLAEELQSQQAERYRIVSVQHQNGVASTNDLVTAEADLTRAELQTQQALIRYYVHLADLKRAVGSISENIE